MVLGVRSVMLYATPWNVRYRAYLNPISHGRYIAEVELEGEGGGDGARYIAEVENVLLFYLFLYFFFVCNWLLLSIDETIRAFIVYSFFRERVYYDVA